MASMSAIKQLTERAVRLENKEKNRAISAKIEAEKTVGFASAAATSAIAGYIDGKFDLSGDGGAGDGLQLFGIPVMPIAGVVVAITGVAVGGKTGSAIAYGGLGISCGWLYGKGFREGSGS